MTSHELNLDGLVGPTHNYSGLSTGNVASEKNAQNVSFPREAALQGLSKMKALHEMGLKQGLLPPQLRPHLATLRALGFTGNDTQIIEKAAKTPNLLVAVCSAASMWTANCATHSPQKDTGDGKSHFTPANLSHKFHRSIEPQQTAKVLKKIFPTEKGFVHHPPLPAGTYFSDEGAANHTRLTDAYETPGVELFVYGRKSFEKGGVEPKIYPARQTLEACEAIARNHQIKNAVFIQQNPEAIDAGVFHNDVASVGNLGFFFFHEKAFLNSTSEIKKLESVYAETTGKKLECLEVKEKEISLKDAVDSYLFNSQIVQIPGQKGMALIAPSECQENKAVSKYLESISSRCPIQKIHFFNLKQSMKNGGGPACLRFRVTLTEDEFKKMHPGVLYSKELHAKLENWIKRHYRERLETNDLRDPKLYEESKQALQSLTEILGLGEIYDF